jgi:hypothetical protein
VTGPVVILASGLRCGSTLLQRWLSSGPALHIWGEPGPALGHVCAFSRDLRQRSERFGPEAWAEYRQPAGIGFIANLLPDGEAQAAAAIALLDALFGTTARALGRERWGFKEVRYGRDTARWLHDLYPDIRVIHLTRNPVDVAASLLEWEQEFDKWTRVDTIESLRWWADVNSSMLDCSQATWILQCTYESVVQDRDVRNLIVRHCGLDGRTLDQSTFDRRIAHAGRQVHRERLASRHDAQALVKALESKVRLASVAAEFGYRLR